MISFHSSPGLTCRSRVRLIHFTAGVLPIGVKRMPQIGSKASVESEYRMSANMEGSPGLRATHWSENQANRSKERRWLRADSALERSPTSTSGTDQPSRTVASENQ